MDRALWKLLWLRHRGGLRRRLQGLRTLKGLTLTTIGVGFVVFWISSSTLVKPPADGAGQPWDMATVRTTATDLLPVLLFGSCLLTVATTSGPAIYFSASEVNFLFTGPFSRRALLLYKFFSYALGAVITSLCLSLIMPRPAVVWFAAFTGTFLTLVFMQLFSAALGLLGQVVSARLLQRVRWIVIGSCLSLLAIAWWQTRGYLNGADLLSWLRTLQQSPWAGWLLAPFEIYTQAVMADDLVGLLRWGSAAAAINLGLLAAVIWLDAEYYEAVEATSQRIHDRWQQYRRGRLFVAEPVTINSRIPRLPRCGGLGPLVRRQLATAWRTNRRSLLVLHLIAAGGGMVLASAVQQGLSSWSVAGVLMATTVVILPRALTFDFRGDADHLAWLKVLPFRPVTVVVGQLLTPTLLATSIHLCILLGAMVCIPTSRRLLMTTLAIVALPTNFLHYALENLVFLINPARVAPIGRVDFEFFGRTLVETMIKMCTIAVAMAIGLIAASQVYMTEQGNLTAAIAVFASTLAVQGLLVALIAAWIFQRFDVAEQPPGDG